MLAYDHSNVTKVHAMTISMQMIPLGVRDEIVSKRLFPKSKDLSFDYIFPTFY